MTLRTMKRLLLLATSVGIVRSECLVRLVNDGGAPVTLRDNSGTTIASQPSGSVGSYVSYPCSTPSFNVSDSNWSAVVSAQGSARATVLVSRQEASAAPTANAFVDADGALSNQLGPYVDGRQPNYMDQCTLRILNVSEFDMFRPGSRRLRKADNASSFLQAFGFSDFVTVQWWTANCYDCALPPGVTVKFAGSSSAYFQIYCGQDVQVRVSAPGLAQQTLVVSLAEHGAYTVLVHNARTGTLEVLVDVPGDFPYTALIVGGVVMCALAVFNKAVRHVLIRNGLVAPEGSKPEAAASAVARVCASLSPLWHFLGYDTYAREQAAAAAAADDGVPEGIAEALLPKDSLGGLNADPETAASQPQRTPALSPAQAALLARLASRSRSIDAFRCGLRSYFLCAAAPCPVNYSAPASAGAPACVS